MRRVITLVLAAALVGGMSLTAVTAARASSSIPYATTSTWTQASGNVALAVAAAPATALATRYEQTNGYLSYAGSWRTARSTNYSGSTAKRASTSGAAMTTTFTGSSLTWIASTSLLNGKARVTLDEGTPVLVDLYSSRPLYRQAVYTTGPLANTTHTLKIEWTGQKYFLSASADVNVDALEIVGSLVAGSATQTTTTAPTPTTTTTPTPTTTPRTTTPPAPTTTTTTPVATIGALSVRDYGAKGDGVTDDRAAVQACINAAAETGKLAYFPAGTYHLHPSGLGLSIPSNVTLRGVGVGSVLELVDGGSYNMAFLALNDADNVTIENLKIQGTRTGASCLLIGISAFETDNLTLDGVTFDNLEYALKLQWQEGKDEHTNVTVTNCATLSHVTNPFYTQHVSGMSVTNCALNASTDGYVEGRQPHHFYINEYTKDLTVSNCTLAGGQHVAIDIFPNHSNLNFNDIILADVMGGIYVEGGKGGVTFDGLTARSSRFWGAYPWIYLLGDADYVTIKDFAITGDPVSTDYLVLSNGCVGTHNSLQNGSMANSSYAGNSPKGCLVVNGGVAPTYGNVTVQ